MTGFESPIERLVEIHDHDDSCLHGDAEKGDIAHPHRDAEVITKQFLQDEAAGERLSGESKTGRMGVETTRCDHATIFPCALEAAEQTMVGIFPVKVVLRVVLACPEQ